MLGAWTGLAGLLLHPGVQVLGGRGGAGRDLHRGEGGGGRGGDRLAEAEARGEAEAGGWLGLAFLGGHVRGVAAGVGEPLVAVHTLEGFVSGVNSNVFLQ